ncbi:unnamed protein product [Cylicostephanus goldi]|uniref:Uncharacterized protein n=1 Tax=Cylicostephanus goldi TaxID=71465 RepID=A0A3P6SHC7_CYLGO|nr:unnamed protein product [Cylicostephanus goldi]
MLETSYNMGATIFQMKRSLKAAFEKINTDPTTKGWFSKFVLYPFDSVSNKNYWYPPVVSTNSDDIVAAVLNITTMACPGPNGCSPSQDNFFCFVEYFSTAAMRMKERG